MVGVKCFAHEPGKQRLFDCGTMNTRSAAQDSFMSLHVQDEDLIQTTALFDIADQEKRSVLQALSLFGISLERLYVDLSFAVDSFKTRLATDDLMRIAGVRS